MAAPKRVYDKGAWLKTARQAIPEIPNIGIPSKWVILKEFATLEKVVFELTCGNDFCHVVIDRKANSLAT